MTDLSVLRIKKPKAANVTVRCWFIDAKMVAWLCPTESLTTPLSWHLMTGMSCQPVEKFEFFYATIAYWFLDICFEMLGSNIFKYFAGIVWWLCLSKGLPGNLKDGRGMETRLKSFHEVSYESWPPWQVKCFWSEDLSFFWDRKKMVPLQNFYWVCYFILK